MSTVTIKPEFEIDTPDGWTTDQKDTGLELRFEDRSDVKVLITFNRVPETLDLHKGGLAFFVNEIRKQLPDAEFRDEAEIDINGLPAIEFEFLHDHQGARVHKLQTFVKDGGLLYSITCIAPEEYFYTLREIFDTITTSFRKPSEEK